MRAIKGSEEFPSYFSCYMSISTYVRTTIRKFQIKTTKAETPYYKCESNQE